jgi:NAD(P)-dependent dehydrogenase (short-subunit alcohol dehydrogenase family)
MFDTAQTEFGGVDVVAHAAGKMMLKLLVDFGRTELDDMHRTNIRGAFVVAQQAAQRLRGGEHDWWAEQGTCVFEPPGDVHTLEIPDGVEEMATLFHVTGAYVYVDEAGAPVGVEDVFSKLERTGSHYTANGIGAVDRLIR